MFEQYKNRLVEQFAASLTEDSLRSEAAKDLEVIRADIIVKKAELQSLFEKEVELKAFVEPVAQEEASDASTEEAPVA